MANGITRTRTSVEEITVSQEARERFRNMFTFMRMNWSPSRTMLIPSKGSASSDITTFYKALALEDSTNSLQHHTEDQAISKP